MLGTSKLFRRAVTKKKKKKQKIKKRLFNFRVLHKVWGTPDSLLFLYFLYVIRRLRHITLHVLDHDTGFLQNPNMSIQSYYTLKLIIYFFCVTVTFTFKSANLLFINLQVHFAAVTGSDLKWMDAMWEQTDILGVWFESFTITRVCVHRGVWCKMCTFKGLRFLRFLFF